ncbi:MAG: class I SAM-dependent methyltransferase, partial [Proteobacteria bacterium]|nr:class I SAM-dependent methyltransferase [Pseudomonadota bacterium]
MKNHDEEIRKQFTVQAARFSEQGLTLSSAEYLQWVVNQLGLNPSFVVLDVAAGTGHLGRAIATHVQRVVAVDLTPAMIAEG